MNEEYSICRSLYVYFSPLIPKLEENTLTTILFGSFPLFDEIEIFRINIANPNIKEETLNKPIQFCI